MNVEIRRLVTKIHDEREFLLFKIAQVKEGDPALGHQIHLLYQSRARYDQVHMARFRKLAKLSGFSGSIERGTRITDPDSEMQVEMHVDEPLDERGEVLMAEVRLEIQPPMVEQEGQMPGTWIEGEDGEDKEDEEEMDRELARMMHVFHVACLDPQGPAPQVE